MLVMRLARIDVDAHLGIRETGILTILSFLTSQIVNNIKVR